MMAGFTLLFILVAGIALWIRKDYLGWIALGKGGLPSNWRGWLVMSRFRMRKRDPIETECYLPDQVKPDNVSYLTDLPRRNGPRPSIAPWPIPHRQMSQFVGSGIRKELESAFAEAVSRHSDTVHFKLSFFEKHCPAVTLREPGCGHPHALFGEGETAHIHPSDGSMHMIFSAADATKVLDASWGERHPMSGVLPELPSTYVYIYPPRDEYELGIVKQLLEAAIAHMAGTGLTHTSKD